MSSAEKARRASPPTMAAARRCSVNARRTEARICKRHMRALSGTGEPGFDNARSNVAWSPVGAREAPEATRPRPPLIAGMRDA